MRVTKTYHEILKAVGEGFRLIVLKGGSRSGKSYALCQAHYTLMNESKRHRKTSMVSHSFPHLKDGLVYDMERFFNTVGINFNKIHNKTDHNIWLNKSVINYFSADQSGKVMGPARDNLHLNEPNKGITFDHYSQLRTRTTDTIFLDYNPTHKFWLHTEGILDDPRTKVVHSTWLDNVANLTAHQRQDFLDAYKKSLLKIPFWVYWWDVFGLGKDGILLEERIMPFIKKVSKVPDDAIEIPSGLDFGWFPDPTCFCRLFIKKGNLIDDLYIMPIIYSTKLSINSRGEGAVNLVDQLEEKGVNKKHKIIAESADPRCVNDMRAAKFQIEAVKKTDVASSIRLFHDYNIHIVDYGQEAFQSVYDEFDNYRYKRDKSTNTILKIPEEKQADHGIDLSRYVLMSRGYRWQV